MFVLQEAGGFPLLLARGDVDVFNVDEFDAALMHLQDGDAAAVFVSLEEASFVCVHAFGILASHAARAARLGRELVLICPEGSFHRKVLRLLRFPHAVAASVEEALTRLRRPGKAVAQT